MTTLELDVHLTAEDDVVVAHDPVLADARRIREPTRADLPPSMRARARWPACWTERGATPCG